jgi:hypothetical protein
VLRFSDDDDLMMWKQLNSNALEQPISIPKTDVRSASSIGRNGE